MYDLIQYGVVAVIVGASVLYLLRWAGRVAARFRDPQRSSCAGNCSCASKGSAASPASVEFIGRIDQAKESP